MDGATTQEFSQDETETIVAGLLLYARYVPDPGPLVDTMERLGAGDARQVVEDIRKRDPFVALQKGYAKLGLSEHAAHLIPAGGGW